MIELQLNKVLHSNQGKMHLEIDLRLASGTFTAIQGKSGAGKTSLLRLIAGLMQPDGGQIEVDGKSWFNSSQQIDLPIQQRKVGYVFQDYALFPNMSVGENLRFALSKHDSTSIVDDLIEIMELGELRNHKPEILSGGQKQRVALARALVQKPSLLLLDEPLSALDNEIRAKLQQHLLELQKEFNLTILMVTHDNGETLKLADSLVVLEQGRVIEEGKPSALLTSSNISGKFQFTGEIVNMQAEGVISILTVLVGKELIKVVSERDEAENLSIGDKVLVASKAFNPIIQRIN